MSDHSDQADCIYASIPDGSIRAFADKSELEAFRQAVQQTEPGWLKQLRTYHSTIQHLREKAARSLDRQRVWPLRETLIEMEAILRRLNKNMADDIQVAAREAFHATQPTNKTEEQPK